MKNQKNDIEKAKELNKKQATKIETLKAGACFGKCNFSDKNCTSCLVFAVCAEKRELDKIKAATEKIKNTAKKAPVKKAAKLTLQDLFYIACRITAKNSKTGAFTLAALALEYNYLSKTLAHRIPQKSQARSFAAHLTDALTQKAPVFKERGQLLTESVCGGAMFVGFNAYNQHINQYFTK